MDSNKDKNKPLNNEESFLLEDDETTIEEEKIDKIDLEKMEKNRKKKRRNRNIIGSIVMLVLSLGLFGFGLLWQEKYDLMAICNALWLAFAIEFAIGWVCLVYNYNIFSPLIQGIKTFGLMFVGKKPKLDYYNYYKKVEENPIPSFYYIVVFISAGVILIPAIILMIILL